MTAFTGAQFSQKQEYEADEYGFEFSVKNGFSPYGMGNSLNKLVELSKGAKSSTVQKSRPFLGGFFACLAILSAADRQDSNRRLRPDKPP